MAIHQFGDHLDDRGAQPRGGAQGEGFGYESAQPVVGWPVEADQVRRDPLPQRATGDALGRQEHALGHAEARVAQHGSHQFVGQQLRPVRADRKRCLATRAGDDFVGLVGALAMS